MCWKFVVFFLFIKYRIDNFRAQQFVSHVGHLIRKLVLSPMWDIFNLYTFMHLLSNYAEKYQGYK